MTPEEAAGRIRDHMIVHRMKEKQAVYITDALWMGIAALEERKTILEKTIRAIIQLQDAINETVNDNVCIMGRFRLDTIMEELKGIKTMIEKDDHNGSRTEKEDAPE